MKHLTKCFFSIFDVAKSDRWVCKIVTQGTYYLFCLRYFCENVISRILSDILVDFRALWSRHICLKGELKIFFSIDHYGLILTMQVPFPPESIGPAHKCISWSTLILYFIPYISAQCWLSITFNSTCLNRSCRGPDISVLPHPVATQLMPWNVSFFVSLDIGKQTGA